ncbi:MAG: methyltransferase [Deltaproteobacteria bacterium]|nr:methyltransferase [Deltaproteobacteria bacterium]
MKKPMTSRERVYAALRHEEPDRVPIDFGGNYNTKVNVIAYNRLKKMLGISSRIHSRNITPMVASSDLDDGLEIMKLMGGDILEFPFNLWLKWKDGSPDGYTGETMEIRLKDGTMCNFPARPKPVVTENGDMELVINGIATHRMPKGGFYFDRVYHPLGNIDTLEQLKAILPEWRKKGYYGVLKEAFLEKAALYARQAHEQTDYFILANMPGNLSIYHIGLEMFGYEKFLIFLAAEKDLVHYWMEFTTRANEKRIADYLKAVGPYINGLILGDDYGTQKGLQISPGMFRELVKPYLTRICSSIHNACPHVKILQHSCGSIAPIIPDLIEAGIDAINPVQTTADNMDAAFLKKEFGKDITFWGGGVSGQTTLMNGNAEDAEKEVEEKMAIFKTGGGYVFAADHDIQEHVMPDVIMATFKTAQKYGVY